MVIFGDVFKYKGKEYVYLARTEEILYGALIVPEKETDSLEKLYNRVSKQPHRVEHIKSNLLYCFVILRTELFKGRAAHFARTDMDNELSFDIFTRLNTEDLLEIKQVIMLKTSPVPPKLKELVADIDV